MDRIDEIQIDFFQRYSKTAEFHTVIIIALTIILLQIPVGITYNFYSITLLVIGSCLFTIFWHHFLIFKLDKKYINYVELAFHTIAINILIGLTGGASSIFLFYSILPVYRLTGIMKKKENILILITIESILVLFICFSPTLITIAKVLPLMAAILILDTALIAQGKIIRDLESSYAKEQSKTEQLTEVNKYKDEFVYLASHELRTPITVVKGYFDLFINEKDNRISEKGKDILSELKSNLDNLSKIVDDMLNLSRMERGKLVISKKAVNITTSINFILDELSINAQKKNIKIVPQISINPDMIINTDEMRFKEIIMNLLDNAIKYTRDNGQIDITADSDGTFLNINIKDNGIGIPEKDQEKIFQKFFRASNTSLLVNKGTGLGLYTVYKIVELLNGHIQFTSQENIGTTFRIQLPLN